MNACFFFAAFAFNIVQTGTLITEITKKNSYITTKEQIKRIKRDDDDDVY